MGKIIACSIYKGGTGKTTTAVNLASALADKGKKVLLVDMDQQASSTRYVGVDPDQVNPTLYHVFLNQVPASLVIRNTAFGFDVVPSTSLMAAIEQSMESDKDETLLRGILAPLKDSCDYIIVDSPPGKAMLAFNAILSADCLLVPVSAERMAIDGLSDLLKHIQDVFWHKFREETADQDIKVLFTMYKAGTSHSPGVVDAARRIYGENVLDVLIPESVEFPRSFDKRMPITFMSPKHPGAKAYRDLADWIINNWKV